MQSQSSPNRVPTGSVLRSLRIGSGMSLRDLSAALGGKPGHQHLARVESGEREASQDLANRIAIAVGERLARLWHKEAS